MGDYGLTVICSDLKAGLQLSRLNLSRSSITRDGVETVCETLAESYNANAGSNDRSNANDRSTSVALSKLTMNRCDVGCESADRIVAGEGKYGRLGPQGREDALGRSMRGVEAIGTRQQQQHCFRVAFNPSCLSHMYKRSSSFGRRLLGQNHIEYMGLTGVAAD